MAADSERCVNPQTSIAEAVFEHVRCVAPADLVGSLMLDTPLVEVGLDSLARMDVVNRIESGFHIRFSEESLYDLETCRDLVELIEESLSAGKSPRVTPLRTPAPIQTDLPRPVPFGPEHYDVASFPECVRFQHRLRETGLAGFHNPFFRVNQEVGPAKATIQGREVINYTSFDYLGMARKPQVAEAAKDAISRFGTSASASRLVGGNNTVLEELDEEIAQFLGTEAAAVFPSGYGTNASLFGHLFGEEDLILYDELAHNSIVQGTLLSSARHRAFPHNDADHVDSLLHDIRSKYRRVVVAIEGVYSMDGDFPDLRRFVEVKKRHQALLYVDEAHSVGVMGATGRGICEHFGIDPNEGDLWMGTISKALGSGGGYMAGRRTLIEYLKYTTPSFVFSTASPPAAAAAALAALRMIHEQPEHVTRLRKRSGLFLKLAHERGLNTGPSSGTPIIPIILGDSRRCLQVSHELLLQGINAQPILYPAVPECAARIRFFITADHTEAQIARTIHILAECLAACDGVPSQRDLDRRTA
ncbi:MAG: aminotransferase class I/II-fold pyridoxal phosphate-dependent enzyme [Pirellulaceae bacterium]